MARGFARCSSSTSRTTITDAFPCPNRVPTLAYLTRYHQMCLLLTTLCWASNQVSPPRELRLYEYGEVIYANHADRLRLWKCTCRGGSGGPRRSQRSRLPMPLAGHTHVDEHDGKQHVYGADAEQLAHRVLRRAHGCRLYRLQLHRLHGRLQDGLRDRRPSEGD